MGLSTTAACASRAQNRTPLIAQNRTQYLAMHGPLAVGEPTLDGDLVFVVWAGVLHVAPDDGALL